MIYIPGHPRHPDKSRTKFICVRISSGQTKTRAYRRVWCPVCISCFITILHYHLWPGCPVTIVGGYACSNKKYFPYNNIIIWIVFLLKEDWELSWNWIFIIWLCFLNKGISPNSDNGLWVVALNFSFYGWLPSSLFGRSWFTDCGDWYRHFCHLAGSWNSDLDANTLKITCK